MSQSIKDPNPVFLYLVIRLKPSSSHKKPVKLEKKSSLNWINDALFEDQIGEGVYLQKKK